MFVSVSTYSAQSSLRSLGGFSRDLLGLFLDLGEQALIFVLPSELLGFSESDEVLVVQPEVLTLELTFESSALVEDGAVGAV